MDKDKAEIKVPAWFDCCLNGECTQKDVCMRYFAAKNQPGKVRAFKVINPKNITEDNDCSYFMQIKKEMLAKGFPDDFFENVTVRNAKNIKAILINYFGRTSFYRMWHGETVMNEQQQAFVRKTYAENGGNKDIEFKIVAENYIWE